MAKRDNYAERERTELLLNYDSREFLAAKCFGPPRIALSSPIS